MKLVSVEVIFKRTLSDVVRNLFVSKAKRLPRVATFKGATNHCIEDGFLSVSWGTTYYTYPLHKVERIKTVYLD